MKKYPKYVVLPIALALYFLAMVVYSIHRNDGHLPADFAVTVTVEVVILVLLFWVLRYLHKKRNQ